MTPSFQISRAWGLPSMAGYLAGCTAVLGLGVVCPVEPFLEPSIPWHILWREQVLLII